MSRVKAGLVLLYQLAYFALKLFAEVLQKVIHYFDGTLAHRARIAHGSSNLVAEVSQVMVKIPAAGMALANHINFICWHEKFVSVDYLLKPNITLYFIGTDSAVFVENLPEVNIYDTNKFPFFFIAQRLSAVKVIEIPLSALVKLSERIGDPACEVGWVFHTARCGSTTVVQGLNGLPNSTVISESQAMLIHLSRMAAKSDVDGEEYLKSETFFKILSATIIFLLKDFKRGQFVCVKTTASLNYPFLPLISRRFPAHKYVSMHRAGPETAKSFWKMANDHTAMTVGIFILKYFPVVISEKLFKKFIYIFSNGLHLETRNYIYSSSLDLFIFFYIQWATNIVTFQRNVKHLPPAQLLPVYYDDFQGAKEETMLKILQHLAMPTDNVELALDAMTGDSQKGTPLSWDNLKDKKPWTRDEKSVEVCKRVLKQFGLPDFDQKFRFTTEYEVELI